MSHADVPTLEEVEERLDVLDYNLDVLHRAAAALATERPDQSLAFMSLAEAFSEESEHLRAMRAGTPDDRYRVLTDTLSNLGTIRSDGDAEVIAAIDERVAGSLKNWD